MDTQTPFSGPSDAWVEGKLRRDHEDSRKRIAELEQENERLRKQVASEKEDGFVEGMERAAEIIEQRRYAKLPVTDSIAAIRAEITDTEK